MLRPVCPGSPEKENSADGGAGKCRRCVSAGEIPSKAKGIGSHRCSGNVERHRKAGNGSEVSPAEKAGPGYVGHYPKHSLDHDRSDYQAGVCGSTVP